MKSKKPNHYRTLGVSPSASDEDIRRAYRERALATHPDCNLDADAAAFRAATEARNVLLDRRARMTYDLSRTLRLKRKRRRNSPPQPVPKAPTTESEIEAFMQRCDRNAERFADRPWLGLLAMLFDGYVTAESLKRRPPT